MKVVKRKSEATEAIDDENNAEFDIATSHIPLLSEQL